MNEEDNLNCGTCHHNKDNRNGRWCYALRSQPTDVCQRHTNPHEAWKATRHKMEKLIASLKNATEA